LKRFVKGAIFQSKNWSRQNETIQLKNLLDLDQQIKAAKLDN
jgi:hypothetical protein